MKKLLKSILLLFPALWAIGCEHKGVQKLDFEAAKKMLSSTEVYQLIDVRTPEEYATGHLKGAVSMNVNGNDFEKKIQTLSKDKPVLVYCLSGGRSANAAGIISEAGFTKVYDIPGIMSWRNNGATLVTEDGHTQSAGMTVADFNKITSSKEFVLVDFNAVWCKPCQKMRPYLEKIALARKARMAFTPIDADANVFLAKALGIETLPNLMLFKDGKLIWSNTGLIEEETLNDILDKKIQ